MDVNITEGERFIPELYGNEKASEPVAFNLKYLTVTEQDEMEYWEVISSKGSKVTMKTHWPDVFRRGVTSVENLKVNGKEIKTAEEFLAIRGSTKMKDFMLAVGMKIKSAAEVDEKN